MPQAIVIREHGGPDVLRLEDVEIGEPGPGQLRLRQTAVAVNYHDVYVRSGLYRTLQLPGTPGLEGVGIVEALGEGVTDFARGDRIGYLHAGYGAYASERIVEAAACARLPAGIDDASAASALLKGVTAAILVHKVHPVAPGAAVLVHAAAGGVGSLVAQWAAHLGARVIGTVGSSAKADLAGHNGCGDVIVLDGGDFAAQVLALTGGAGVSAAFDAVGRDTFDGSLAALGVCGHLINYGQSSGPIPPFEIARLAPRSLSVSRPGYSHYLPTPDEFRRVAGMVFAAIADGVLRPAPARAVPLADAALAHAGLEARQGPFVLLP